MNTFAYLVDWESDGKFESKTATEDIISYGVIKTNNDATTIYCLPDNTFDYPSNLNETIESEFGRKTYSVGGVLCAMSSGIFTYISEDSAKAKASFANFAYGCEYFKAVKCVIPKGTTFYDASAVYKGNADEDMWNPTNRYIGYLSDKIIIKEVI